MYKVIVEFYQSNILAINADDPIVAAQNIRKLFEQGKAKSQVRTINVFHEDDNIYEAPPLHTTNVFYD
jgi:hypothetical protein